MSQDLFAAFGSQEDAIDPSSAATHLPTHGAPPNVAGNGPPVHTVQQILSVDDEDDFGDFEDASTTPMPVPPTSGCGYLPSKVSTSRSAPASRSKPLYELATRAPDVGSHPFAGNMDILFAANDEEYDAGQDEMSNIANNPEAAMAYSKRIIAEQQAAQEKASKVTTIPLAKPAGNADLNQSQPEGGPNKLRKMSGYAPTRDPNVLFDADDVSEHEEAEDDFGDFEGDELSTEKRGVTEVKAKAEPNIDLLDLDDHPTWQQESAPREDANPGSVSNDSWDDFDISESSPPATTIMSKKTAAPTQPRQAAPAPKTVQGSDLKALPPTNVPPPAIILSLFPSIFSSAQDALFGPMAKLDLKQRQMLLAHPATHMFLKGYLTLGVVLGHIVAGRRLRWKRDQYLAQGMRIGPSTAGGRGGMKIAGVDKSEAAKEDREVLDTVTMWKAQLGKLRTAVTSACTAPKNSKLPHVPEIAETMAIKTLKAVEGGFTAPHACALCGLKREERVAKVDVEVDDSFGEWWVEGMSMHVVCRNFWQEHKTKLKSR